MRRKTFKRTLVSAAVLLASTHASAALYQVVELTPPNSGYESAFGVAIQPGDATDGSATLSQGCFDSSATNCTSSDFAFAGETRSVAINAGQAVDGISYREEVPWGIDNAFIYIQDQDDFEDYCNSELLYATCESWAQVRWDVWNDEKSGSTTPNAIAFVGSTAGTTLADTTNTYNTVINSLDTSGNAVGIKLAAGSVKYADSDGGYIRDDVTGLYGSSSSYSDPSGAQVRAWKTDGTFISGSIATYATTDNGSYYSTKPALWSADGSSVVSLSWPSGTQKEDDRLAQGSIRDFYVDTTNNELYAVGYSTFDDDENYMNAAVFKVAYTGSSDTSWQTASNWTTTSVSNATSEVSGDYIYSNSKLTGINENLVAIGEAKRDGNHPANGAAANRMFVVSNVSSSPTATYFSGGIFFSGAGGKAEAINNYNEIVGQVDAENVRESDGKVRRKRAFIYPYSGTGTDSTRRARFSNQAWWLDNLTNGGTYSSANNAYRIIDASGINDAGVISATALKCDGGYDSTAYDATCGGGDQDEEIVAVELLPIAGATASDISERGESDDDSVSRSGGSLGLGSLIALGLFGFRRKK